tara:strand:- start:258 stop:677 length:420 start_codon:yes stop_codon:yes gene_type:complete
MLIFFFIFVALPTALTSRLFGLIATGIKGKRTPYIQFMQYRFEGVLAFITSAFFIHWFISAQSQMNILFDFTETIGGSKIVPAFPIHWLGLIAICVYNGACFLTEWGPYNVWFVKYNNLTDQKKKELGRKNRKRAIDFG